MRDKGHIRKSHNVTMLLYHIVLPARYRKDVFTKEVFDTLIEICQHIEIGYEIMFLEIGNNEDHVHFMVQGVLSMSVAEIIRIMKSITTTEIMNVHRKDIKKKLGGGKLRTSGFYANTVGAFAGEQAIRNYIKNQGMSTYKIWHQRNLDKGIVPLFPADVSR